MTDATSPWPERRRTQGLLLGAGGALVAVVGLALADVVALSQTATVGATTVASVLLIYGLLGWAGTWVADDVESEGVREDDGDGEADEDVVDRGDTSGDDADGDGAGGDDDGDGVEDRKVDGGGNGDGCGNADDGEDAHDGGNADGDDADDRPTAG